MGDRKRSKKAALRRAAETDAALQRAQRIAEIFRSLAMGAAATAATLSAVVPKIMGG